MCVFVPQVLIRACVIKVLQASLSHGSSGPAAGLHHFGAKRVADRRLRAHGGVTGRFLPADLEVMQWDCTRRSQKAYVAHLEVCACANMHVNMWQERKKEERGLEGGVRVLGFFKNKSIREFSAV